MGDQTVGDALVGRVLTGAYRIERRIGQGGMGVVYEATHTRIQRRFAIKVLHLLRTGEDSLERFKREAMLGSRLGNDYIVAVVDFNRTEEGNPFLVMELLEGETLQRVLEREGKLSLERAASITRQVCLALATAHAEGVIHRDLKPENIFLCRSPGGGEKVKVLDFGISKVMGSSQNLTSENQILGTPWYMAPEQVKGKAGKIDHRADLYALGLVLYHMLSGRRPIEADGVPAILMQVLEGPTAPLWTFCPDLPQEVLQVVNRAICRNPEGRHGSALELAADLERAVGEQWNEVLRVELGESGRAPAARPGRSIPSFADAVSTTLASLQEAGAEERAGAPASAGVGAAPSVAPSYRAGELVPITGRQSRLPRLLALVALVAVLGFVSTFLILRARDPGSSPSTGDVAAVRRTAARIGEPSIGKATGGRTGPTEGTTAPVPAPTTRVSRAVNADQGPRDLGLDARQRAVRPVRRVPPTPKVRAPRRGSDAGEFMSW